MNQNKGLISIPTRGQFSLLLDKLRRSNTTFEDYVESRYLKDGTAVITYTIDDYYDIVNCHSPKNNLTLNPEFEEYVQDGLEVVPSKYPLKVNIEGAELDEGPKKGIEDAFLTQSVISAETVRVSRNDLVFKIVLLAILTVISFIVSRTYAGGVDAIVTGLDILFWVIAWELAYALIFEVPEYFEEKSRLAQVAHITLSFSGKNGNKS